MSSDTTTETGTPGSMPPEANPGGAEADGGARTYGPAPAPMNDAPAPPQAAANPVSRRAPKAKTPRAPKNAGAPSMASVAYQQSDQVPTGPVPAGPEPSGPPGPLPSGPPQYGPPHVADAVPGTDVPAPGLPPVPAPGPTAGPAGPAAGPGHRLGPQPQRPPRPQQAPRGRKARLRIAKVDPWSVMKTTFVLAIALAIVSIVAVALLWSALNALGVFSSLNHTLASIAPAGQTSSYTLSNVLSFSKVISFTALISVVNIVLLTALATLGAYLYNMCSALVGGIEITLADDIS